MLEISHLNFNYPNLKVIHDLSIKIDTNEIVSIIGHKHSGKSTLFKIIAGLQLPTTGKIIFMDNDITTKRKLNGELFCQARYKGLFYGLTVRENIELGGWRIKDKNILKENFEKTIELIPHLQKSYNKNIKKLCNGERMLTAIARAIISFPKLIVIDEPMLGFYPLFVEKIADLIYKANKLGITFLLLQKNISDAVKISNRIYEMEDGQIIKEGNSKSFEKFDLPL